jgi:imidazolonepropionase-like amidohydrolase
VPASLAFTGVSVIPMDREVVLPDQSLIVRDGRIVKIGDSAVVSTSGVDQVVDGRGRFLMPGLADMHVHAWSPAHLVQFLAYGVTTVRNMWGSPMQLAWRKAIERGSMLGPTIFTAGPIMDGDPPIWPPSKVIRNAEEARQSVRTQKAQGYDFVKVYNRLSAEAYEATAEEAHEQNLPVAGHVPSSVGLRGALRHRQASIEHLEGYREAALPAAAASPGGSENKQWWQTVEDVDPSRFPALAEETRRAGTWNCVTRVVYQKFQPPAEAAHLLLAPEMRYAAPSDLSYWQDYPNDFRIKNLPEGMWPARRRMMEHGVTLVRALHDAGAGILLGSDTPNPFVIPGFSLHEELANLVMIGLSPYEALCAGTLDAANFLGKNLEFGSVEVGKRADLLLVEGNPLEDVGCASKIAGVMVRGRWISSAERSQMLEELVRSYGRSGAELRAELPAISPGTDPQPLLYRQKSTQRDTGAESWVVSHRTSGGEVVACSVSNNSPHLDRFRFRLSWDESGAALEAEFHARRREGDWSLRLAAHEGTVTASGGGPDGWEMEPPTTLSPGSFLFVPLGASYLPVMQRLLLASGSDALTVPFARFELEPAFALDTGTFEVHLERRSTPGPGDDTPLLTYVLEERGSHGKTPGRLVYDPRIRALTLIEVGSDSSILEV